MSQIQDILARLVGFDTVSAGSNLALIVFVEGYLKDRNFRVTRLQEPEEDKAGLYAEIGPAGPGVLLSAHSDVVPVTGQTWTRPPFRLTAEGDRLYGRGTTDMKGFLATMLTVADAASRASLKEPLKLVISYDEEIGCVGIARMIGRLAPLMGQPRMAIVGEPTMMQVATGHKGKRAYRAVFTGEAGHSALAPRFVNALTVAADAVKALETIQQDLAAQGARDEAYDIPYSTVHVGTLTGGRALNIVPDRAEMTFEIRHLATDDPDKLEARIKSALDAVCAKHGPAASVTLTPLASYPGLAATENAEIVEQVQALAETETTKVAFGTEAGVFAECGIPTVVCGPGSMADQGHKADEYISVSQLTACENMLGRLLQRISD